MELKEKIEKRIEELKKYREQLIAEFQKCDAALGELSAILEEKEDAKEGSN